MPDDRRLAGRVRRRPAARPCASAKCFDQACCPDNACREVSAATRLATRCPLFPEPSAYSRNGADDRRRAIDMTTLELTMKREQSVTLRSLLGAATLLGVV